MKRLMWIVTAVFLAAAAGVVWYAIFGSAWQTRLTMTNAPGVPTGVTWVYADTGLDGGPVTALSSAGADMLYAETLGDVLYASSDGGTTWEPVSGTSSGHYVAAIEADTSSGTTVLWKAVYGAGFFASKDEGKTWAASSHGLRSRQLTCCARPAGVPATLYVGTADAGLFVSRDGGASWRVSIPASLARYVAAVAVTADGRALYAGTRDRGLLRSQDAGATWTAVNLPSGPAPIIASVDIDPQDGSHVAVLGSGGLVALSEDGGQTWRAPASEKLPSGCSALRFLADGSGLVAGTQGGTLWRSVDGLAWQLVYSLPESGCVYQLQRWQKHMLAATSHGVFSSTDGKAWVSMSSGIRNLTIGEVAASPTQPSVAFAATSQGVFRSENGAASWIRCSPEIPTLSVLALPDGRTVLAGTSGGLVLRSTDGGDHWTTVHAGIPGMQVSILVSSATEPGVVYCGTDNGVAVSVDSGATWETRIRGLVPTVRSGEAAPRVEMGALLSDPVTPHRVMAALLGHGLVVSDDDGSDWRLMPSWRATPWVYSLAADRTGTHVFAGTDVQGVLVSHDGGATWTASGTGLSTLLSVPGVIRDLLVAQDGTVYAASAARGVARSSDGGATWLRVNHGMPELDVRCLAEAGGRVLAATAHRVLVLQGQ
ncbi:MAG TPA: hypothetical protein PKH46_03775 [Candidatus Cryosericum sp.]|nr:hypothetical protein [Candidatus Cryosericum sp.]